MCACGGVVSLTLRTHSTNSNCIGVRQRGIVHRCRNKPSSSSSSRVPSNSMKQKKSVQNTFRLSALVLVPWDGRVCVCWYDWASFMLSKRHTTVSVFDGRSTRTDGRRTTRAWVCGPSTPWNPFLGVVCTSPRDILYTVFVFCSETFNGFSENLPSDSWLCSTWTFSVCIERRAYSIRRGKQQCTVSTWGVETKEL